MDIKPSEMVLLPPFLNSPAVLTTEFLYQVRNRTSSFSKSLLVTKMEKEA